MTKSGSSKTTITVGKLSVEVTVAEVPVQQISFYRENPRIYTILRQHGRDVTQDVIEAELWALDSTKDLFHDIRTNGGLLEEILVKDSEVLEGNSRLCAYRRLLKKAEDEEDEKAVSRWSTIRAKILPPDLAEEVIFTILGILHVRGKAKWLPYEQAGYLHRQSVEFRKSDSQLAEQIGCSEADIKTAIKAFKMMEKGRVKDPNRHSYFVEFVKSRKMKDVDEFLPRDFDLESKFVEWVEDGVIPRAEHVRHLPLILRDKKARGKFLADKIGFEDALEIARDRHPETRSSFYNKLKNATDALANAEALSIKGQIEQDVGKKYILKNLRKTVNKFCKSVDLVEQARPRRRRSRRP